MGNKKLKMKSYEDLRFSDDFMFGKIMEDPVLCREVLECLLERPVGELREVQTQKEFKYTSDGKPIRLDVYNEDSNNIVYDAEMENLNHKSIESHELPRRSRFYQGSIDIDYMHRGNSYRSLPDSNILFVCTFDPFRKGLRQYTFKERCNEDPDILLCDGTAKIFYNCKYNGEDIPEGLRKLYDYIMTDRAEDELTKKLEKAVSEGRKNEAWRTQYMKEWVIIQDAIWEERERADRERKRADEERARANKLEKEIEELKRKLEAYQSQ